IGLHDESPDEENEDGGDEQRLIPLSRGRVGSGGFLRDFRTCRRCLAHSTFRTARKASWGMSTRPTRFIRFFPSFCFSSSFRLLMELAFSSDISTITLREHIFPDRRDGLPRDDLRTDRRLNHHLKHLPGDDFFHLGGEDASLRGRLLPMNDE